MGNELENRIEAILFASGKGVSEEDLAEYCEVKVDKIKAALTALEAQFEKSEGSLVIGKNGEKWKLTVRGKYLEDVQKIVSETELPTPMLKTLAVIAFKSPVLQAEVINIRGQGAYEHVRELVKEKFITKDEEGRSYLLKITDKFYNYFDVEGDQEIREVFEKLRKEQKTIGDLKVVDAKGEDSQEEKAKEKKAQQKLGDLDIVESDPYAKKEDVMIRRKEKTQEDKDEENAFLKKIDEGINQISSRIEEHKLPARQIEEDEDEEENTSKSEEIFGEKEEKKAEEEENNNEEKMTPIEEIEAFVEEHDKKDTGEKYL